MKVCKNRKLNNAQKFVSLYGSGRSKALYHYIGANCLITTLVQMPFGRMCPHGKHNIIIYKQLLISFIWSLSIIIIIVSASSKTQELNELGTFHPPRMKVGAKCNSGDLE